jgi:tetratricopeptide (TPR) repeat protein
MSVIRPLRQGGRDLTRELQEALALVRSGDPAGALCRVEQVLAVAPRLVAAHNLKGIAAAKSGDKQTALAAFEEAVRIDPADFDAQMNRARLLESMGQPESAFAAFAQTRWLRPQSPDPLVRMGGILMAWGRKAAALAAFEAALKLDPANYAAGNNKATLLLGLDRLDEALAACDRAIAARPGHAAAYCNRGTILHGLGRYEDAHSAFQDGLSRDPNSAELLYSRGLVRLLTGDLPGGFRDYTSRWQARGVALEKLDLKCALWDGAPLAGKRILLHGEQGLGDTIQFMRYAPLVAERGGRVILGLPASLCRLASTLAGVEAVVSTVASADAGIDLHCPLLSLPSAFKTTLATIPAQVPYLAADPERVARWRARLGEGGRKIGICWQGNPNNPTDRKRSAGLRAFAPLAAIQGVRLISLQKDFGQEQVADLPAGMSVETLGADFDAGPDGFLDTAALMMALDLVISVDTSVAHLAGALARPAWVALPYVPDWRWLLEREDSPWYPTLRLFRQNRAGDWSAPFARMAQALLQS